MRRAFLRYLDAPSLQRTLAFAEERKWDAWSPQEIVRFLTYKFSIAAGAAPAYLLSAIVNKLFENPELRAVYVKNKRKFILEVARLERCVPLVNFTAYKFSLANGKRNVTMFGKPIAVPDGTPLHCSVQNANRDGRSLRCFVSAVFLTLCTGAVDVFGADAECFVFDRPDQQLGLMMTFNGTDNKIVHSNNLNTPVRRCPGRGFALDIIEFLVDRFLPPDHPLIDEDVSIAEIATRETFFMKIVLGLGKATYSQNNKYFPHASQVLHPMDTAGKKLGSEPIVACGGRLIPRYGEFLDVSRATAN